jgi:hypothetical protein
MQGQCALLLLLLLLLLCAAMAASLLLSAVVVDVNPGSLLWVLAQCVGHRTGTMGVTELAQRIVTQAPVPLQPLYPGIRAVKGRGGDLSQKHTVAQVQQEHSTAHVPAAMTHVAAAAATNDYLQCRWGCIRLPLLLPAAAWAAAVAAGWAAAAAVAAG